MAFTSTGSSPTEGIVSTVCIENAFPGSSRVKVTVVPKPQEALKRELELPESLRSCKKARVLEAKDMNADSFAPITFAENIYQALKAKGWDCCIKRKDEYKCSLIKEGRDFKVKIYPMENNMAEVEFKGRYYRIGGMHRRCAMVSTLPEFYFRLMRWM